jgi:hypothetical protein
MNVSLSSSIEYFKWPFKYTNKKNGFANSIFLCSVKNKQTQLGFAKPMLGFAKLNMPLVLQIQIILNFVIWFIKFIEHQIVFPKCVLSFMSVEKCKNYCLKRKKVVVGAILDFSMDKDRKNFASDLDES